MGATTHRPMRLGDEQFGSPETFDLQQVIAQITGTVTAERLAQLLPDMENRQRMLGGTVWGTLLWPKALGRPTTPRLAAGFAFRHWTHPVYKDIAGHLEIVGTEPQLPPVPWDGTDDQGWYRVNFATRAVPDQLNAITICIRTGVLWQDRADTLGSGAVAVTPAEARFVHRGVAVVLPPFRLKLAPAWGQMTKCQTLADDLEAEMHSGVEQPHSSAS
ncbi:conserved protein of unknown function [Rhodovastum atsumiense]|uniref:Uncharacterized protein n=1 Tax=Rhodovastum atsumiense TaxID=504468 RepID=A0A5M6IZQ8_9PROT|nr:hypothetical protein [Rhodovastum atsumiense]KAA5613822.1 hypothetical protein F1189_03330 [Rhodovastum atsumiense]CAH2601924.1 conserved protein of unknown function [Rhodovastum atsumiense]